MVAYLDFFKDGHHRLTRVEPVNYHISASITLSIAVSKYVFEGGKLIYCS